MAELGKRGLAYIDDGSSARSLAPDLALKDGVPFVAGDMAIDAVQDRGAILKSSTRWKPQRAPKAPPSA